MTLTQRPGRNPGWTYKETLADGTTSDPVIIPPLQNDSGNVTCTIIANANTGKMQSTTSPDANIAADTATWVDWPNGDTNGTYTDALITPVTAVRGISVSGEITFEVVF